MRYIETEKNTHLKQYIHIVQSNLLLLLTIFNEGAYLTFKSIFHKALNLSYTDCEITLESVPGTNQY